MAANVMFHQLGRRRADRVFRQRFSIDNMGEFGGDIVSEKIQ